MINKKHKCQEHRCMIFCQCMVYFNDTSHSGRQWSLYIEDHLVMPTPHSAKQTLIYPLNSWFVLSIYPDFPCTYRLCDFANFPGDRYFYVPQYVKRITLIFTVFNLHEKNWWDMHIPPILYCIPWKKFGRYSGFVHFLFVLSMEVRNKLHCSIPTRCEFVRF